MSRFDEIRPYDDNELQAALRRIASDDECIALIGQIRFPRHIKLFGWLLKPLLRWRLSRRVNSIDTVHDFQLIVERYLVSMLDKTTTGLTISGLDNIDLSSAHLFMSNHRDITLDPALVNYALHHHGGKTTRIAIGDNLLSKPFASDLMRANKSFIVKRSVNGPRELLKTLKTLSSYIWHSLKQDQENIWIAHREGRAKDGIDKTDPAVIKMLTIAKPKTESFADYIKQLQIIPVSVSYEYDPCDAMKANELRLIEEQGSYTKAEHEDMDSIGRGISGDKGNIYLHFGEPLTGEYADPEAVARVIDRAIVQNYRIQPTNILAYELLYGKEALDAALAQNGLFQPGEQYHSESDREKFHQRIAELPDQDTIYALTIYANPIVNRINICGNQQ